MAINRVFNGTSIRIPSNWGGITTEQRVTRDLKWFLRTLDIKSAGYPPGFKFIRRVSPGPKQ